MSLSVYVESGKKVTETCHCCGNDYETDEEPYFDANYTHNVVPIADRAGIYGFVWRPEENGITTASDLIQPLREGIERMEANPEDYLPLNPENGWGDYESFLKWLKQYLYACEQYPDALIRASR